MSRINITKFQLLIFSAIFLLSLFTTIAFYPALSNDFVLWDTYNYVIGNPYIRSLTWENLIWMFTSFHMSNWQPLTFLSYSVDYALFGLNPWDFTLSILFYTFLT